MIDLVEEGYYDADHVVFLGVLGLALGSFDRLGICFPPQCLNAVYDELNREAFALAPDLKRSTMTRSTCTTLA